MNKKHTTASELRDHVYQNGFEAEKKQDQKKKHDDLLTTNKQDTGPAKLEDATSKMKSFSKRPVRTTPRERRNRGGLFNPAQSNLFDKRHGEAEQRASRGQSGMKRSHDGTYSSEGARMYPPYNQISNPARTINKTRGKNTPHPNEKQSSGGHLTPPTGGFSNNRVSTRRDNRHGNKWFPGTFGTTEYYNHKRRRFERAQKKASADEFCLISVKKTKNNTHCAISRLFGDRKTMWTTSGGQTPTIGSKSNGRRKSRYCQRMIFKAATEQLLGFGFKYLVIHCIGRAISKRYIFRNFYRRFRIVLLKDLLAVAHNGCRPRKARRL